VVAKGPGGKKGATIYGGGSSFPGEIGSPQVANTFGKRSFRRMIVVHGRAVTPLTDGRLGGILIQSILRFKAGFLRSYSMWIKRDLNQHFG